MSIDNFKSLKNGIHAMMQIAESPENAATLEDGTEVMTIIANGIQCILSYSPMVREDRAFLFCVFGDIPADLELLALRRLLETNFVIFKGNAPTFARDPVSGQIMLLAEVFLASATAESVLETAIIFSKQVVEWHKTYFVEDLVQVNPQQKSAQDPLFAQAV